MPAQKFEEKKDSFKIIFSHTKVVFSYLKSTKRPEYDNFGHIPAASIIALCKKSLLFL
jgi:hypothetical protein